MTLVGLCKTEFVCNDKFSKEVESFKYLDLAFFFIDWSTSDSNSLYTL